MIITIDARHAVIKAHHITKGLVNKTIVHPREVYRPAIKDNAVAVILAHNHPTGYVGTPSNEDDDITERLCMAGHILGIHVLDHIIIAPDPSNYYSYVEHRRLIRDFSRGQEREFIFGLVAEDKKLQEEKLYVGT